MLVLDGAGVLIDANGIFGYAWSEGETDEPREYHAEFAITSPKVLKKHILRPASPASGSRGMFSEQIR
jgi:hypothetical protein